MEYEIYYSDKDVLDLINDVEKMNNETMDTVVYYLNNAEEQKGKLISTIEQIKDYQSDNEGWRSEFYSDDRQNKVKELEKTLTEDQIDEEFEKYIDYLDEKYPEFESDEKYTESEVEKDLQEAWKLDDEIEKSIKNLKALIIKLEEL